MNKNECYVFNGIYQCSLINKKIEHFDNEKIDKCEKKTKYLKDKTYLCCDGYAPEDYHCAHCSYCCDWKDAVSKDGKCPDYCKCEDRNEKLKKIARDNPELTQQEQINLLNQINKEEIRTYKITPIDKWHAGPFMFNRIGEEDERPCKNGYNTEKELCYNKFGVDINKNIAPAKDWARGGESAFYRGGKYDYIYESKPPKSEYPIFKIHMYKNSVRIATGTLKWNADLSINGSYRRTIEDIVSLSFTINGITFNETMQKINYNQHYEAKNGELVRFDAIFVNPEEDKTLILDITLDESDSFSSGGWKLIDNKEKNEEEHIKSCKDPEYLCCKGDDPKDYSCEECNDCCRDKDAISSDGKSIKCPEYCGCN